jgi:hypothetical protein
MRTAAEHGRIEDETLKTVICPIKSRNAPRRDQLVQFLVYRSDRPDFGIGDFAAPPLSVQLVFGKGPVEGRKFGEQPFGKVRTSRSG